MGCIKRDSPLVFVMGPIDYLHFIWGYWAHPPVDAQIDGFYGNEREPWRSSSHSYVGKARLYICNIYILNDYTVYILLCVYIYNVYMYTLTISNPNVWVVQNHTWSLCAQLYVWHHQPPVMYRSLCSFCTSSWQRGAVMAEVMQTIGFAAGWVCPWTDATSSYGLHWFVDSNWWRPTLWPHEEMESLWRSGQVQKISIYPLANCYITMERFTIFNR